MRVPAKLTHPSQVVTFGFASAILLGTALLYLPFAAEPNRDTTLLEALFTATSAICVTGLVVVDTGTHWSAFGEVVVMLLIQLGGLGIMTLASLGAILVSRRLGLRTRLLANAERGALGLGDVRQVVLGVVFFSAMFEAIAATLLAIRFWTVYDQPFGEALYHGLFHAVSAFNNAGFGLRPDNLVAFVGDWWVNLTVAGAIILGGIGFPVLIELRRAWRSPRTWSLHTRLTLAATALLLVAGTVMITSMEWTNPDTLGPMPVPDKVLAGGFQAVVPRTAGFNTLDYSKMDEETWIVTDILMFIGAGSASTAGGIKVSTFALLGLVVWAEIRGDPDVTVFRRKVPTDSQRQAVAIAIIGITAVVVSAFLLTVFDRFPFSHNLFETISAFGTVGLSTGITAQISSAGQLLLVLMMFLGRVGPLTLGTAFVLRQRDRLYNFPEERPLIG